MADSSRIRIFLIDDHAVVRAGLSGILGREPDMEVVGEATSGEDALPLIQSIEPDIALLDYRLSGMQGDAFINELSRTNLKTCVVVLSAFLDEDIVQASFVAGARGYVVKDVDASELRRAIRAVARGGSYVDPKVAGRLIGRAARLDARASNSLRPPEIEILGHVGRGLTNAEIGQKMGMSRHTIGSKLGVIFAKLGASDRSQAVAVAMRRGLILRGLEVEP